MRVDAGLTQRDLERASGIPKSRISRYENGHLLPSLQGLARLAKSLGVPDSALLTDVEDPYAALSDALRRNGVELTSSAQAEEIAARIAADLRPPAFPPIRRASIRRA